MSILKPEWLPECKMDRIIVHWTAGTYRPSSLDLKHYHFLVDGDGVGHVGRPVSANAAPIRSGYAAHTLNCNTGSIGIAACCMAGAQERPFQPGPCPMKELQWQAMAQVAAELSPYYSIPVSPKTMLGHGEVQTILGIQQRGKWDPMILPWNRQEAEPMKRFRELVREALRA